MNKKKLLTLSLLIIISKTIFAFSHLEGEYTCNGDDRQDKALLNTTLALTLDSKNSLPKNSYGAYKIKWTAPPALAVKDLPPNIAATGAIAANGNMLALTFKNTNPKAKDDYGVLIGTAVHTKNAQGLRRTILYFFGYQPEYKGGDNSTWSCIKK